METQKCNVHPKWRVRLLGETLIFNGGSEDDKNTFIEEFQRLKEESQQLNDDGEISDSTYMQNIALIEKAKHEFEQFIESNNNYE